MTRTPQQVIAAFADAARLAPYRDRTHADGAATWRDALFAASDGTWALSRPGDPDRALLAGLAEEFARLDEHVAGMPRALHLSWLRDTLGIERLPVVPDTVVASATVEPKLAPAVVAPGTVLRGGKDAYGNERRYRTVDALTAYGARLAGVRVKVPGAVSPGVHGAVYAADAKEGFPITPPTTPAEREAAPPADHVMRITSPALGFVGGSMRVSLGFIATNVPGGPARIATLRAAAQWRHPLPDGTMSTPVGGDGSGYGIEVTMSGGCVDPAGGDPWIECVIPDATPVPEGAAFHHVQVAVIERSGVLPDAAFANDGLVDITKEFEPFAATAAKGDAFYVRSEEALSKNLASLTVSVEGFAEAHGGANVGDWQLQAYLEIAHTEETVTYVTWGPHGHKSSQSGAPPLGLGWQRLLAAGWSPFGDQLTGFGGTTGAVSGEGSLPSQVSGQAGRYVRCFISSGDLGWAEYQDKLAEFATKAVKAPTTVPDMPQPLTPAIFKNLSLGYTTSPVDAARVESRSGWRHSVMGTGVWQPFRLDVDANGSTGMVAIGIDVPQAVAGSSVSLYVELDSASPCGATDAVSGDWQWWNGSAWEALLVADGTSRLRESGLLRFVAPDAWAEGCDDVTAASGRWIRMVTKDPDRLGILRGVIPDAVLAAYVSSAPDPQADPTPAEALPVGAIKGTLAPIVGVKKVTNLASVRGRGPEGDDAYARRAAALVRHRGRAITSWDYEQMVAIQFPEVAAVRCLPHTNSAGLREPGRVGLVVIPDEPTRPQPRPSVSLSGRVTEALAGVMPVGARVSILCPKYIAVTVKAEIRLARGVAAISGKAAVTAALETLLHPTGTTPTRWGVSLYPSALVAALERLANVDVVLDFEMLVGGVHAEIAEVDACRGLYCSSGNHELACVEQL